MSQNNNNSRNDHSFVQKALEYLRLAISSAQLRPNQQVIEAEIADKLGMSRTPVRDAIRHLEILGYFTRLPNHRLIVAHKTPRELQNYYEVRDALETMAIRLTCQRASKEQIDRIRKNNDLCNKAIEHRDPSKMFVSNMDFHKLIVLSSGNEELWLHIEKYFWFDSHIPYLFTRRHWRTMQKQHDKIVDALCQRNQTKAVNAIHKHLRSAADIVIRLT